MMLAGVLAGLKLSPSSPQPLPTFRSSVEAVRISVVVRDRRGRLVTNLTRRDFEVFDNGERRTIIDFQSDRTSSVTLAVLLDMSGSMGVGPKMDVARRALRELTAELREGHDEIGLFTFDAGLEEQQSFTQSHPSLLDDALIAAQPFGTTSLYDAIAETARRLDDRSSQRRAIVVLTDGVDTSSVLTPAEVSRLASSIDVPVYAVVTAPPIDRQIGRGDGTGRMARSSADLRDLTLWTGGELLWEGTGDDAALNGHRILLELRQQYLIAIEASTGPAWRPLDVRVRDPYLTVRARRGYFSGDHQLSK